MVAVLCYLNREGRIILAYAQAAAPANNWRFDADWAEFDDSAVQRKWQDDWLIEAVGSAALMAAETCDNRKQFAGFLRRQGMLEFPWIIELVNQLPDPE
jgi:hypothetical protein